MNMTKSHLLLALLLIGLASAPGQADVLRVLEEKVGPVPEFIITLRKGETISFETRNLSPEIDPVLHLWDLTNRVEVAMDDNSGGGKAARLRKVISQTGDYLLIVRPRNFFSAGTTDIHKNGLLWKRGVAVEGWYVFLLSLKAKEQISVLPSPLGAPTHLVYTISQDGLHIESRRRGRPRSRWEAPAGIFGARTLLIGVQAEDGGKPMRLYRNDVKLPGADPDGDGLGTELERQLKTCSAASDSFGTLRCDSNQVADLRDTDGDGISDGWEVLGREFSPTVYLPLPTWGSNPRHKDMFIEADYRRLSKTENDAHIAEKMTVEVAIQFAETYGDKDTTDPLIRRLHALLIGNPDREPGISVHIDTGRKPEIPAHAGIYGDWGGYNTIDAVPRNGAFVGQAPADLWKTQMHPSRRGIFRYGPGHKVGGAQCAIGAVFCGYNFHDAANAIHEMMHSLGFDHSGPVGSLGANCKPNYPSAVSYAYMSTMVMSDGRNRPPLNNTALKESLAVPTSNTRYFDDLEQRFKYRVDRINGQVDWNRDGVFAPVGQTVRAYANYQPGGFGGCEFTRLNQVKFPATATSVAITRLGVHTLLFSVEPGGTVRLRNSISNWKCSPAAENCSGSSFGAAVTIIPFPVATRSVDAEAVSINGVDEVSLVAIGSDGRIRERRITLTSKGVLRVSPDAPVIPSAVAAAGEPSLAATRDGRGIYLIYKGADNLLRWRFRNSPNWPEEIVARNTIGNSLVAAEESSPGIASAYLPSTLNSTAALHLVFSDATHSLKMFFLNSASQWQQTSLLASDDPIVNTVGRPTMAWVPNAAGVDSPGQFYVVFRAADGTYNMMRTFFDESNLMQKRIRIGLKSEFDNVYLKGGTIDVTTSSSTGQPQLWAVLSFIRRDDDGNPEPFILFRPRADGIVDLELTNHNDWPPLGRGVCKSVVNPQNTVPNPIRCPNGPL
jgi:hypothetical protein